VADGECGFAETRKGHFVDNHRPEAVNISNVANLVDGEGKPHFKYVIEGANLFFTQQARFWLEKKGVVLFKDSSTNKVGLGFINAFFCRKPTSWATFIVAACYDALVWQKLTLNREESRPRLLRFSPVLV
jgi:hypothetical protein